VTRADRVAALLDGRGVDALLVTAPANLRYVTGFGGSTAIAVVGPELRRFITDFRYVERAAGEVHGFDVERGDRELLATLERGWPVREFIRPVSMRSRFSVPPTPVFTGAAVGVGAAVVGLAWYARHRATRVAAVAPAVAAAGRWWRRGA